MTGYRRWRPMPPGRYRSRGESEVAGLLRGASVRYVYEPQLRLATPSGSDDLSHRLRWVRPDFYLPDHHSVIEYAGRMDLPDYRRRHTQKTRLYELNGYHCHEVLPEDQGRSHWGARLLDAIVEASMNRNPYRLGQPPADVKTGGHGYRLAYAPHVYLDGYHDELIYGRFPQRNHPPPKPS